MTVIDRVISLAKSEVGYLEKESNKNLDDKTSNAGDKNYTKYARDLDAIGFYGNKVNGYAWCASFFDWLMVQTYGIDLALEMTGQKIGGYGASCTESVKYYKSIGRFFISEPQIGDQIFFTKDNGRSYYHTGIVSKVGNGKVYTIEGNTSSVSGVVDNGGSVCEKSYLLSYNRIGGYGRPNYALVEKKEKEDDIMTGAEILNALTDEQAYNLLTKAQRYASTLAEPTWSKNEGHWTRAEMSGVINGGSPEGLVKRDEIVAILGRKGLI